MDRAQQHRERCSAPAEQPPGQGLDGLGRVDEQQRTMLRSLGATRWQTLRFLEAPAALPAALSGAKVAVAVGSIAAVFAEYATAVSVICCSPRSRGFKPIWRGLRSWCWQPCRSCAFPPSPDSRDT